MDWNWFFSAVSQSAAAIVGIFAAFIITAIIKNQTEFHRKRDRIQELDIATREHLQIFANFPFDHLNRREMELALARLERQVAQEGQTRDPRHYLATLEWPLYVESDVIFQGITATLKDCEAHDFYKPHSKGPRQHEASIHTTLIHSDIERRRLVLSHLEDHIVRMKRMNEEAARDPESSGLVTWVIVALLVLFFAGVVYPLSFLPVPEGADTHLSFSPFFGILFSLKGVILAAVSIVFSAVLLVFARLNSTMRYSAEEKEALQRYSRIGEYSPYLSNMVENNRIQREATESERRQTH